MLVAGSDDAKREADEAIGRVDMHAFPRREVCKAPRALRAADRRRSVGAARRATRPAERLARDGQTHSADLAGSDGSQNGLTALRLEQVEAPPDVQREAHRPEQGSSARDAARAPEDVEEESARAVVGGPRGSAPWAT